MDSITFEQLPIAVSQLNQKLENIERLLISQSNKDNPKETEEKLLTVEAAASFLSLSVPTIYSKVSRNELPFMKRGKRLYFSQIELLEYLKRGRVKSNDELQLEAALYTSKKKVGRV
jgi:excisionase family DNA binding protein